MLRRAWRWLQAALFPLFCVACGEEGEWWCSLCRDKVVEQVGRFCPICREKRDTVCGSCRALSSLDSIESQFIYNETNPIGKLIGFFKYHHAQSVSTVLESVVRLSQEMHPSTVVVPVPLFRQRERDRGFNQAGIIATIIARKYGLIYNERLLKRVKNTVQQATLSGKERTLNMRDAIEWMGEGVPEHVLLVDDVFTTGATMQACAKVLKENGVKTVAGYALATPHNG